MAVLNLQNLIPAREQINFGTDAAPLMRDFRHMKELTGEEVGRYYQLLQDLNTLNTNLQASIQAPNGHGTPPEIIQELEGKLDIALQTLIIETPGEVLNKLGYAVKGEILRYWMGLYQTGEPVPNAPRRVRKRK